MKLTYAGILSGFFFCLLFTGCFSNYSVNDFSSQEEFYQRINDFSKNKNVDVVLKKDSLISSEGIEIKNDSLYLISRKIEKVISLSSIADINYSIIDYNSAHILLKNGQEFQAENIITSPDSMKFLSVKEILVTRNPIAVGEIKEIKYKKRWLGVPQGILAGAAAGALIGLTGVIPVYESHPDMGGETPGAERKVFEPGSGMIYGAVSGALIGGIIGWIIGYNYSYVFR